MLQTVKQGPRGCTAPRGATDPVACRRGAHSRLQHGSGLASPAQGSIAGAQAPWQAAESATNRLSPVSQEGIAVDPAPASRPEGEPQRAQATLRCAAALAARPRPPYPPTSAQPGCTAARTRRHAAAGPQAAARPGSGLLLLGTVCSPGQRSARPPHWAGQEQDSAQAASPAGEGRTQPPHSVIARLRGRRALSRCRRQTGVSPCRWACHWLSACWVSGLP